MAVPGAVVIDPVMIAHQFVARATV